MTEHAPHGDSRTAVAPPFAIGAETWPGLGKVSEEGGELIQVVGKLMAYPTAPHPDGSDLRARLIEEAGDVLAALWYALDANDIWKEAENQAVTKYARFRLWHRQERREGEYAAQPGATQSTRRS